MVLGRSTCAVCSMHLPFAEEGQRLPNKENTVGASRITHCHYLDPKSIQNNSLFGNLKWYWAIILHTLGVQVLNNLLVPSSMIEHSPSIPKMIPVLITRHTYGARQTGWEGSCRPQQKRLKTRTQNKPVDLAWAAAKDFILNDYNSDTIWFTVYCILILW